MYAWARCHLLNKFWSSWRVFVWTYKWGVRVCDLIHRLFLSFLKSCSSMLLVQFSLVGLNFFHFLSYQWNMDPRLFSVPTESEEFECFASVEEMWKLLECRGITCFDNFRYRFEAVKGKHQLSEMNNQRRENNWFLLSLYVIETRFHLPLHPFFWLKFWVHMEWFLIN